MLSSIIYQINIFLIIQPLILNENLAFANSTNSTVSYHVVVEEKAFPPIIVPEDSEDNGTVLFEQEISSDSQPTNLTPEKFQKEPDVIVNTLRKNSHPARPVTTKMSLPQTTEPSLDITKPKTTGPIINSRLTTRERIRESIVETTESSKIEVTSPLKTNKTLSDTVPTPASLASTEIPPTPTTTTTKSNQDLINESLRETSKTKDQIVVQANMTSKSVPMIASNPTTPSKIKENFTTTESSPIQNSTDSKVKTSESRSEPLTIVVAPEVINHTASEFLNTTETTATTETIREIQTTTEVRDAQSVLDATETTATTERIREMSSTTGVVRDAQPILDATETTATTERIREIQTTTEVRDAQPIPPPRRSRITSRDEARASPTSTTTITPDTAHATQEPPRKFIEDALISVTTTTTTRSPQNTNSSIADSVPTNPPEITTTSNGPMEHPKIYFSLPETNITADSTPQSSANETQVIVDETVDDLTMPTTTLPTSDVDTEDDVYSLNQVIANNLMKIEMSTLEYTLYVLVCATFWVAAKFMLSNRKDCLDSSPPSLMKLQDEKISLDSMKKSLDNLKKSLIEGHKSVTIVDEISRIERENSCLNRKLELQRRIAPIRKLLKEFDTVDYDIVIKQRREYLTKILLLYKSAKERKQLKDKLFYCKYDQIKAINNIIGLKNLLDVMRGIELDQMSNKLKEETYEAKIHAEFIEEQMILFNKLTQEFMDYYNQKIKEIEEQTKADVRNTQEYNRLKVELRELNKVSIDDWNRRINDKMAEAYKFYRSYINDYYNVQSYYVNQ